tara:strand:+ start:2125 stop:3135 length:1011 start_codon:yes stop_codon:yes gene_type:complete
MKIFKVGGAIRDELLGLTPDESDWVVIDSSPEEMFSKGFKKIGKDFPVFLHPKTKEAYALGRKEKKVGKKHGDFEFVFDKTISLEEDLQRRDLTINAIAQNENGDLIDPFGGVDDLKNKVLRHVSESFFEDSLRALRLARFYAKFTDFKIHESTKKVLQKISQSGELHYLSGERVWEETSKALKYDFSRFLEVITNFNLQEPWFSKLIKIPKIIDQRPEIALSQVNQANEFDFCLKLKKYMPKKIIHHQKIWKQIQRFNKKSSFDDKFIFFSSFLNDKNRVIFLEIIKHFDDKKEYCCNIIDEITKTDFTDLTSLKYDEIETIKKRKIISIIKRYE